MNFRPLKLYKINYSMYIDAGESLNNKFNATYMYYDTFFTRTEMCLGEGLSSFHKNRTHASFDELQELGNQKKENSSMTTNI